MDDPNDRIDRATNQLAAKVIFAGVAALGFGVYMYVKGVRDGTAADISFSKLLFICGGLLLLPFLIVLAVARTMRNADRSARIRLLILLGLVMLGSVIAVFVLRG
ncbi:MAG TPA: hypothetical protein VH370_15870 [Humisphaera sp.]|nr:hypothetical protein [Humisphaera sp.]